MPLRGDISFWFNIVILRPDTESLTEQWFRSNLISGVFL